MTDFANGFANCVTRDGQSPALANIPMGGFKITGLAAGTTNGDAVRYEQAVLLSTLASTASASDGDALVGVLEETGAVATTQHEVNSRFRNVFAYFSAAQRADVLAKTGSLDVTSAIQDAIDAAGENSTLYFPPGLYRVTDELVVSENRVHLVGAGSWSTRFLFLPTADASCIKLDASGSVLFQGSVQGFSFYSTDSTYSKTAIEEVDTSGYLFEDIVVGGSVVAVPGSTFWSGGTASIGIHYKGREAVVSRRLYIYADQPIRISENPNNSIDIDHFHFQDTYLGAADNACVTVDSGINLTNVTFDGYNVWVLGTHGFYWSDSATTGVSQTLSFSGVRTEQGTDAAAWCFYIDHNYGLQGLSIENHQGGFERDGIYLRNVTGVSLKNNINTGGAGRTVLDVDSTVSGIDITECFWQDGSDASMSGQVLVYESPKPATGSPLAPSARYQSSSIASKRTSTELANGGYLLTLTNGATAVIGANTTAGMLTVVDSEYFSAIFNVRGTNNAVSEVADPVGVFSVTSGTATSTNVYWSAGNTRYEIQNNRGNTRRYLIILDGTYTSF